MTEWITHTIEPWMPAGALKAKDDYQKIAQDTGYRVLDLLRYNDARFSDQVRQEKIEEWLAPIKAGDLIVHQFPTYMSANFELQFLKAVHQHGAQFAILIHDLEPLRFHKDQPYEFAYLKQADYVVTHSQAMDTVLRNAGVMTPTFHQELFDYLGTTSHWAGYSAEINFAGTFQKSPWLTDYTGPQLNLLGARPKKWQDVNFPPDIDYRGNFDPEAVLNQLTTGWGLIWDSDFKDRYYQQYTRLNAPHKASLYLRAGLPLIAWSQSYLGTLIKQYHWGLTIDNLSHLEQVEQISPAQYKHYQDNIQRVAQQLAAGEFSKKVLRTLKKRG